MSPAAGKIEGFEFEAYRKDGHRVWLRANAREMRNGDGVVLHYLGALENITDRKLLEDQLRQSQKLEAIGQLAGGVAHDFNNLLMIISGYTQMLEDELPRNSHLRSNSQQVLHAVERAASLTGQLLAFSRKQVLSPQIVDLNAVVGDTAKMLRRLIGENIELFFAPHEELWKVKSDPGQITQVLLNLCLNGRDAMPKGGRLTIETENVIVRPDLGGYPQGVPEGRYAMLAVSDTGIGMAKATLERIFEPFFTTKELRNGTGLGLSTVYGIVKQAGGYIFVDSEPGEGTRFRVYLPTTDDIESVAPTAILHVEGSKKTILVVEDESQLRHAVCTYLTRLGYTVLESANGTEALEVADLHAGKIHLLLTDVVMPRLSGPELASRLQCNRQLKILFMSGYADDSLINSSMFRAGITYIQKPFSLPALSTKLAALINGDIGIEDSPLAR